MKIEETRTAVLNVVCDGPAQAKDAPSGAKPLLPEPLDAMLMGEDIIAKLSALLAKGYREDRKEAKKLAKIEQNLQAAEVAKRVRELHAKAETTRSGAIVAGVTGMVGGAAQIAGATASLWTPGAGPQGAASDSAMKARWRTEDLVSGSLQGAGNVTKSAGELGAGVYRAEGDDCDARAAQHEGNAEAAKRRATEYADEAEDAKRMLQKVADFLREMRTAQQGAASAALYRA